MCSPDLLLVRALPLFLTLPPLSLSLSLSLSLPLSPSLLLTLCEQSHEVRGPSGARAATLLNTPPSLSLSLSPSLSLSLSLSPPLSLSLSA